MPCQTAENLNIYLFTIHIIFLGKKYTKRCITLLIRLFIIFSVVNRPEDDCFHQKFQELYKTRPVASTYACGMNVTTTQRWGYNNGDVTVNDVGQLKRASLQCVGENEQLYLDQVAINFIQFALCRVLFQFTSDRFCYCTNAIVICKKKNGKKRDQEKRQ